MRAGLETMRGLGSAGVSRERAVGDALEGDEEAAVRTLEAAGAPAGDQGRRERLLAVGTGDLVLVACVDVSRHPFTVANPVRRRPGGGRT